jgi:hypothetical protein
MTTIFDFALALIVICLGFAALAALCSLPTSRLEARVMLDEWFDRLLDRGEDRYYAKLDHLYERKVWRDPTMEHSPLRCDLHWLAFRIRMARLSVDEWLFWRIDRLARFLHIVPPPLVKRPSWFTRACRRWLDRHIPLHDGCPGCPGCISNLDRLNGIGGLRDREFGRLFDNQD